MVNSYNTWKTNLGDAIAVWNLLESKHRVIQIERIDRFYHFIYEVMP